ncbi:MAG: DUF2804 domain-containing protein [Bacteroidia bacterium]|nr:DUF2804 domain-containing protein [Bacteroidia bacterium]
MSLTPISAVAPPSLPQPHDKYTSFGLFRGLIPNVSTQQWDSRWRVRYFKRKSWIFMGVQTAEYLLGFAIADAGYIGTAFTYCYDVQNNQYWEEKITRPWAFGAKFDPNLKTSWKLANWNIEHSQGGLRFQFLGKKIQLSIVVPELGTGVSIIAPAFPNPFHFTWKNMLLPAFVELQTPLGKHTFEGNYAAIDFSKGYPPPRTFWNWASCTGTTQFQQKIAINLVSDFNNGLENVIWFGDNLYSTGQAIFHYRKPLQKSKWHIHSLDNCVSLDFQPLEARSESINLGLIKSQFMQPFGRFSGNIQFPNSHEFFSGFGVTEEHLAIW